MFLIKSYKKPSQTTKHKEEVVHVFDRSGSQRKLFIILVSVFLAFYFCSENLYLKFSATYFQNIPLKLSASEAAELFLWMTVSHTCGRVISVFVAFKVKPEIMITYHSIILIISLISLYLVENSLTYLWVSSLMMSFGFSAIYPAIFAFVGQYLEMTDIIGTILSFSVTFLNLFMPFILGSFIEVYPNVFVLTIFINFSISLFLFIILQFIVMKNINFYVRIDD